MAKILVAYIPVLHEGYRKLFELHEDVSVIYILGRDLISEIDYLEKEIRALEPELIKKSLNGWGLNSEFIILEKDNLSSVQTFSGEIIMPDDDVSHYLNDTYFINKKVRFESVFLRWDRRNSVRQNKIANDQTITSDEFSRKMMISAESEAEKSSDWWRHVGAIIIQNGEVISKGHNQHLPTEHTQYIDGDPRNAFHKGENLELSTAIHIEARLIAEAAAEGTSLSGAEMYVTTFPCPPCAKMIAYSGIKKLYYKEGYGVLDGENVLKNKGVDICQVK